MNSRCNVVFTVDYLKIAIPSEYIDDNYYDFVVTDLVESITPDKLKGLRLILNSTAMDIMYYTSPLYRGEVCNKLTCLMYSG